MSETEQVAANWQWFWFPKSTILISQKYGSVTVDKYIFGRILL